MKLLYNDMVIFESDSEEKLLKYREEFIFQKEKKYVGILSKVNRSYDKAKDIIGRNYYESDEIYLKKIKAANPEFIELVEEIGKELFEEKIEYFYLDVPKRLFGIKINDEYFTPTELTNICLKKILTEKDFKIE